MYRSYLTTALLNSLGHPSLFEEKCVNSNTADGDAGLRLREAELVQTKSGCIKISKQGDVLRGSLLSRGPKP